MRIDSLNKKNVLLILVVTVVFITGAIVMVSQIVTKVARAKYDIDNDTAIQVLSYSVAPMLSAYDYKQIENLIIASLNYQNIEYISVFDKNRKLVKSATKKDIAPGDVEIATHRITTSLDGIIGNLEIGFSKKYIDHYVEVITLSLGLGLMGGFLLLGLCLYVLMRRQIIEPIESLTATISEIDSRSLSSRVKVFRRDEIGTLASRFNRMAGNLERSHSELQESESKYRSMMEAMNDAVYICSSDRRIEYMNPAMIEKIGRDATGEACYDVAFGRQESCPWCRYDEVLTGKGQTFEIQNPVDRRYYQVSNAPITHADGSRSMLALMKDITEIKSLQSHLIQAQKMESIGTMAAGIAHDFNNILSVIYGYTEIARQSADAGDNTDKSLDKVLEAAGRARDLVGQILTFSRKSEDKKHPVKVDLVVKEVLKFLRSSLPSSIRIDHVHEADTSVVMANSTQVHQVLMNLCTNASHAMKERKGTLTVKLDNTVVDATVAARYPDLSPGDHLRIAVTDTGHGMSPEVQEKIFEPYFTTKKKGEGTGLGMAVAHGIVKSHNGSIDLESEPGKGTTFQIYLPVIEEIESQAQEQRQIQTSGNERLLMVDDEADLTNLAKMFLGKLGYDVVGATSGKEALDIFRAAPQTFDMVITDMTMPDLSGRQLTLELKKISPQIAVILCTGSSSGNSDSWSEENGVDEVLTKPYSMHDLSDAVRRILDEHRQA